MSVHSQDSDNEELGAIGGNKPISRQVSPFSRPSSVVIMESLTKTLTEQMQQKQQEQMLQQEHRLMHSINSSLNTLKDQSDTTNSTLADLSRSQTDISARLERLERASPDLNPVELRTNPSDGNFVFHAVPPQVTAPLIATRPSITSEVSNVISPFGRSSRAAEGPQLPRSDCHLSVPRKTRLTSDSVTISPVARSREPGYEPKFPTFGDEDGISIRKTVESGSRDRDDGYNVGRRTDGRETIIYEEEFIVDENRNRSRDIGRIVVDNMSGIDGTRTRNVPNLNSGVSNSRSFTKCSGVMNSRHSEAERYVEESVAHSCSEPGLNTMRSQSTAAFEFNPSLDHATANSRMVVNIPGNKSVVYTSARIQPSVYDRPTSPIYTAEDYEHEKRTIHLHSSSVPYTLASSFADPRRNQYPVRPRTERIQPPIVSYRRPRSQGAGALLFHDGGKEIHLPPGLDQIYLADQNRSYALATPRISVASQTEPVELHSVSTAPAETTLNPQLNTAAAVSTTTSVNQSATSAPTTTNVSDRSKKYGKIKEYTGTSPLGPFLREFHVAAKQNEWTKEDQFSHLLLALTGQASQITWKEDVDTVDELIQRLTDRFGSEGQQAIHLAELNGKRQKVDEPLAAVYTDVKRLSMLAFPGKSTQHSELLSTHAFLNSLLDRELAKDVLTQGIENLDQAYKVAVKLHAYKQIEQERTKEKTWNRPRVQHVYGNGPKINTDLQRMEQRFEQLEKAIQSIGRPTPNDASQVNACQRPQQAPFAEQAPSSWNNQAYGPNWQPPPMQFNGQFPPTGHRSMNSRRGKNCNFDPQSWTNGANNEDMSLQQLFEDAREDLHRADDQAIAACAIKSFSSARVKVKIRGRNVMTLLDTGSGTNLLERKYVHPRGLRPSQQSVRAANGTTIRIVGEATVSMQVGVKTYRVPVLVTDQMSGLTLGLPWLRRYHLIWKLCDNWVTLDNQIVDLYTSTTENECRRVEVDTTRQEISPAIRPVPKKPNVETTLVEEKEEKMDDRPATAVALDNQSAYLAVQPATLYIQPVTNTVAVSMPYVTPTVTSALITANMINGSKNLDQEYKQQELERGIDKNLTRARMENVQKNVFNVNVVMQNVEQGLGQREMALQATGGSPTSDVRPGSAQAYATPEHMPTKPFVTQAASSSNRLGYAPAYP